MDPGMADATSRASEAPAEDHFEPKRRKVRKGTQSCWECKRLKARCSFASPADTTCRGCNRRGTRCISQEFPEELARAGRSLPIGDRLGRMETLVEKLVRNVDGTSHKDLLDLSLHRQSKSDLLDKHRSLAGHNNPSLLNLETVPRRAITSLTGLRSSPKPSLPTRHNQLADVLIDAWPSQIDLDSILCLPVDIQSIFHRAIAVCTSYSSLQDDARLSPRDILQLPAAGSHPVLISRKLLILGVFLQSIPSYYVENLRGLSIPYQDIESRVVETASTEVTSKDELVGSIEGIECIMIESMYQSNAGNLRRSWLTLRRAMLIAQMMGLYRGELSPSLVMLDPGTRNRINPEHMWFRIVQSDRYLSLMLGLPQGSIDDSFATPMALDGCTGREVMERIESVAAGRILQRNHTDILDLDATRDIDKLLREASSSMPAQWWLNPDFISTANDEGVALRETVRIMDHFVHYNLLAHLHLPYMLHFSADEKYDYSKIMAVNASRELLMRFVSFHKFNKSHIHCRGIDFFAFIASTTLCLAHIDSHHRRRDGMDADSRVVFAFLAHQRLGDRGLMERALETMQQMASRDIVTSRIGHILRHLLAIEADAEDGGIYCTSSTSEESKEELECGEVSDSGNVLRIYVPYFGTVKVERSGVSKTVSRMPEASSLGLPDSRGMSRLTPHQQGGYNKLLSTENLRACEAAGTQPVNADFHAISSDIDRLLPSPGSAPTAENHGFLHDFHVSGAENSQQLLGPELVASVDDWALQGVDIALFDSLIRGSDSDS